MIDKNKIIEIIDNFNSDKDMFLVDCKVSTSNKITIRIDGMHGVSIDDCVALSRSIEGEFDRETEDFELEVSSAGLDHPFVVPKQFEKNIGKMVKATLNDGKSEKGKLLSADDEKIVLEQEFRQKTQGKKKKELVKKELLINLEDIKTIKLAISF